MRRLKNKKGFTFIEMLASMLVVMLLILVINSGMNMAKSGYQGCNFESDSQMLEATINVYMADVLRHTSAVITTEGVVSGISNVAYDISNGYIAIVNGRFYIYKNPTDTAPSLLASNGLYTDLLEVENFVLTYDETTGVFTGSYDILGKAPLGACKTCEFTYRRIYQ